MKDFKIYTAGKMLGLTYDQQMTWRKTIETMIRDRTAKPVTFIHPPLFYRYDKPEEYQSQKEIMDWDISQVRDSDIVIVNLDGVLDSIGTHFELGVANAMNSFGDKHVYVIGVGNPDGFLHPWIELSLHRRETSFEDAADYIARYLLV